MKCNVWSSQKQCLVVFWRNVQLEFGKNGVRIWIYPTESKTVLFFRSKMRVSSPMSEYVSPHKKKVTFSSLGTSVRIRTPHFQHPVGNEIRRSSDSHHIQHEQTDEAPFWGTQARTEMQTFASETGKSEQTIERTIFIFVSSEEPVPVVINAAMILVSADHIDIFDISLVQRKKGIKSVIPFFGLL